MSRVCRSSSKSTKSLPRAAGDRPGMGDRRAPSSPIRPRSSSLSDRAPQPPRDGRPDVASAEPTRPSIHPRPTPPGQRRAADRRPGAWRAADRRRPCARMAREVRGGRVADAHQHEVAVDPSQACRAGRSVRGGGGRHGARRGPAAAARPASSRQDPDAASADRRPRPRLADPACRSTTGRDLNAGVEAVERRLVAVAFAVATTAAVPGLTP